MAELMTFDAANRFLAGLTNVPTVLSSAELAVSPMLGAGAKAHAFFSARVSSDNILEALREQVVELAEGRINLATARMRLKTFLAAQGFPADDVGMTAEPPPGVDVDTWKARKEITNIASTRRLDLIMRQNAGQAHAVGRREVSMHPAVMDRWPYYRYISRDDAAVRPSHARLDNLVLPKEDPFWHTHTGPWDYNCRCDVEDADLEEAEELGGVGQTTAQGKVLNPANGQVAETLPSQSGYVFDVEAALSTNPADYDWDAITDATMRNMARSEMGALMEENT